MAIPVSIDTLLNKNVVEWERIEFKEGLITADINL